MNLTHTLSETQAQRRMPAISHIQDRRVRQATLELTRQAPAWFWSTPAASPDSDYHHPETRRQRGLWAHSLALVPVALELWDSTRELHGLDAYDRDCVVAACILHDQRKYGADDEPADAALADHDLRMAGVIKGTDGLPPAVERAVASHMGPWYDGPEPDAPVSALVHRADMLASTDHIDPCLPEPVPEELAHLDLRSVTLG